MSSILDIKNLYINYKSSSGDISAVNDVSFSIKKGELFALVGESGCGKSTVASSIIKLMSKNAYIKSGEIVLNDTDIVNYTEKQMEQVRGKEVGIIFQNPLDSLNPVYKIKNQIEETLSLDDMSKDEVKKRCIEIIKELAIGDPEQRAENYPFEMSGGMRQRIMIGMMISRNPKLIIADEPTTALDVTIQAQILALIKKIQEENGSSVLLITHDFGVVAEMADRVGIMYAGNLVEIGPVMDIFDNPMHPYTKALMQSLPTITKHEGKLKSIEGSIPVLKNVDDGCRFFERCDCSVERCKTQNPPITSKGEHSVSCHVVEVNNG